MDEPYYGGVSHLLPFVYSRSMVISSGIIQPSVTTGFISDIPKIERSPSSVYLDTLPFEIREQISRECNQADAFHLCLTSRSLFESTISRLYQCIVIDPALRHFNKEIYKKRSIIHEPFYNDSDKSFQVDLYHSSNYGSQQYSEFPIATIDIAYTLVRSVGGIRACLRTLKKDDGFKSKFIKRFECNNSLDLPEYEVSQAVLNIFPKLINLQSLIWKSSPEMTIEILNSLPNRDKIDTLDLEMALRPGSWVLKLSEMNFSNLRYLSISPYVNSDILKLIAKMLCNSKNIEKLRSLYIAKDLPNTHEISTAFSFSMVHLSSEQLDLNSLTSFFKVFQNSKKKLNLLRFGIVGTLVNPQDADLLINNMELNHLINFSLSNITEVQGFGNDNNNNINEQRRNLIPSFLKRLEYKMPNVNVLTLDIKENLIDSLSNFIYSFKNLKSLDLKIHWNITKLSNYSSWNNLCEKYIESILFHKNTLKHLSIDSREESSFCDPYKLISIKLLLQIAECKKLIGLRIHNSSIQPYIGALVSNLPKLKYLDLFGEEGPSYLGTKSTYLLDHWVRYEQVVNIIIAAQPNIEYIRINKYVFDVKDKSTRTVIREGIDEWLDEKLLIRWKP